MVERQNSDLEFEEPPLFVAASLLRLFAMGDKDVKLALSDSNVMGLIAQAFAIMDHKAKPATMILQMIKDLTYERACLDLLGDVWIVPLLDLAKFYVAKGEFLNEIFNNVTVVFYHLCRFSRTRKVVAAGAGLIPILQFVVQHNKPLKDFAVPMVCEFSQNRETREVMMKNGGLPFYKFILAEPESATVHSDALNSIADCLTHHNSETEAFMMESSDGGSIIKLLVEILRHPLDQRLIYLLDAVLRTLTASPTINAAVCANRTKSGSGGSQIVEVLRGKLSHPDPVARLALLRVLQQLCRGTTPSNTFLVENGLQKVVEHMSVNDQAEPARRMATMLLKE